MRDPVSIDETIKFLNSLLQLDSAAITDLLETRVSCSRELADHPTVQVTDYGIDTPKVGLLGVLNGLFGVDAQGWGPIAAVFDDEATLIRFERVKHG